MKKQIVNEKVFRNYLNLHKIDENFEAFVEDHKPAQVSLQNLNVDKLMFRISQLNMCKAVNRRINDLPSSDSTEESWKKGELKFFAWTVLFYCYSQQITPKNMNIHDFEFIHTIFQTHSTQRLEFEVRCLFGQSLSKNKDWSSQHSLLLEKIIKEHLKKEEKVEWKIVAYELYIRSSGECFKGFKHCREMWINHLDPEVNRGKWSTQEQKILLKSVMKYGCQWATIAKQFNGSRTEHMVKNKYSSIISAQKKLYPGTSIEELERSYLQKLSGSNSESFENLSDSHSLQCSSNGMGEKISNPSGMDSEPRSDMSSIFENYQTPFEKIQSDSNRTEDSMEYFNFDNLMLDYKKVELQEVIEDVLPKLGYAHPEQLSFFFEESPSLGESWLNSYSY